MGQCPSCGNKGFILRTKSCVVCGKEGCKKCQTAPVQVTWYAHASPDNEKLNMCTGCKSAFATKVEKEILPAHIQLDNVDIPVDQFIHSSLLTGVYHLSEGLSKALESYPLRRRTDKSNRGLTYEVDADLWGRLERVGKIVRAETLEKAGRFEEAAKAYEQLKMYDKAGRARKKRVIEPALPLHPPQINHTQITESRHPAGYIGVAFGFVLILGALFAASYETSRYVGIRPFGYWITSQPYQDYAFPLALMAILSFIVGIVFLRRKSRVR